MQIFHKGTDNSKNERCQGFQNFTFQFIYAQRSKKCMMVSNSKLCKYSMYYAPLYAAICNQYSKRLHLSHVNPFLKLKLFLQNISGLQLPSSGPCIKKIKARSFFSRTIQKIRKHSFLQIPNIVSIFTLTPFLHRKPMN